MITLRKVEQFLARLPAIRVLVLGDLMLDEYIWGRTDRISPEAPVPIVRVMREELRLGGAGNVINNLLALNCKVQVVSVLGEDRDAERLISLLRAKGIETDGIFRMPGRTTSRKTRVSASNQQMLRIDRETIDPISPDLEKAVIDWIRRKGKNFALFLVSDYLKGVLTKDVLASIISLGREMGMPVLVDPKGYDFTRYKGATLLTPNCKEAEAATRIPIVDEKSLIAAGRILCDELALDALVLTRGEEGMTIFRPHGNEVHLPTRAREVFDVSGAGDTVLAMLGLGLAGGLTLEDTAQLANIAAGIVVGKVGTSAVGPPELMEEVARLRQDTDIKIKGRETLGLILDKIRDQGKTIVFTNGCFDLLHAGHVKYLQMARRLGDLLVLGLNSDDSVRRLKGPRRPLIDQDARANILAALDCVDYVVIFEEDTPLDLIKALRPHILVKGGDYTPEQVVGKDLVESYGGRVELITFVDGRSTTGIIEEILQKYQEG